jgi:hypothetical protein
MHEIPYFAVCGGWRRRDEFDALEPTRWARLREAFELDDDLVPGEAVLRDLASGPQTAGSATRILARFVTLRFLVFATDAPRATAELQEERTWAAPYTAALRAPPAEARALRALVALGRDAPPRRIMVFLDDAATAALAARHIGGAFALHRFAYRLAVEHAWRPEAADAAESIAHLAEQCCADYSRRLWRRRARVLRRPAEAS